MSSKSKRTENVINIDQILGDQDTQLDYDLTDSIPVPELEQEVDAKDDIPEENHIETDYSTNKSLVAKPNSDITVTIGQKNLDKMRDNHLLDVNSFKAKRIVHPKMEKYEILNVFREIRTKILQSSDGKNQLIMVVSLQHGMGTTFSAVNLAAAFSYEGEKTSLLIDCDLNKHKLEKFFEVDVSFGLTDYLDDNDIDTNKIIYQTGINRMRFIPVGKRRETVGEFFSSQRMKEFVMHVKRRYSDRYIILNAPPLEVTADAAIIADVCDKIIIVLPYGQVSNQRLKKAIKLLPKEKILGVVINDKTKYV